MTITIKNLQEYFKVQIERKVTNLFFYTDEGYPSSEDKWRARSFPADNLGELVGYLEGYKYYSTTTHMPRFYKE